MNKIAFGGGCHWCTEAIFQALKGVDKVEQGWVNSQAPNQSFSEAVLVHYQPKLIDLKTLIEIHLLTHSSTSQHEMRSKYRSAIYYFNNTDKKMAMHYLKLLSTENAQNYITKAIPFVDFMLNEKQFLNYYKSNPNKPFCETYITPKLQKLMNSHSVYLNLEKVEILT